MAVLDIYNPAATPERSIVRARRTTASSPQSTDHRRLPLAGASCDAVFLILAAHELRSRRARTELFTEVRRTLAPGGRVLVVEHLRDAWNFAAFGPGFLHFFSRREWLATFAASGLRVESESRITPMVRAFMLWRDNR